MKRNFLLCGTIGWCLEILFTSIKKISFDNYTLKGETSIWMFPIYGMAAFLAPLCKFLKNRNILLRGIIYTVCIFITEFFTGSFLKKYNLCPWDYSKSKLNIRGVIRIDYAPLWFLTGLLYEKILFRRR